MIKCQELLNQASCLNKAGFEEPIFVLRANDPVAAQAIRHWAAMSIGLHEPEKISEALNTAAVMEDWRNKQPRAVCENQAQGGIGTIGGTLSAGAIGAAPWRSQPARG